MIVETTWLQEHTAAINPPLMANYNIKASLIISLQIFMNSHCIARCSLTSLLIVNYEYSFMICLRASVFALKHVSDGLHIRVVRSQRSLLNYQRLLQQRSPHRIIPLQHAQNLYILHAPCQVSFRFPNLLPALMLLNSSSATASDSKETQQALRRWRQMFCSHTRQEQHHSLNRIKQAHVVCVALTDMCSGFLEVPVQAKSTTSHRRCKEAQTCSRCSTARSVRVCATSVELGP